MRTIFRWSQLPFAEAIQFFSSKLNIDTDSWRDITGAEQLAVFMVAGAKGALLSDIRKEVDAAIEQGITLKEFQANFDQIVAKRGWSYTGNRDWRSNLIWETNLRSAYGNGREEQIQRVKSRRPFVMWRHGGSDDPRPTHLANDGKVYRTDERPTRLPHGYGCRCVYFSLSQRDMERLGLTLSEPLPVPREPGWTQQLGSLGDSERSNLQASLLGRLQPDIAIAVAEESSNFAG